MGIYKSKEGKIKSLDLYDKQLIKLNVPFSDIYVETSFGRTHLIETGNKTGKPLLVFHGGNSTTAYNLLLCRFLLNDFHVYAVDTIGHPGKSDEVCLSHRGYDYGKWASEVIDAIGYGKIACFGGSFGGGILAKLMCVAPEKVDKAVLLVPAGISNAIPISSLKMMIPLLQYRITKKEKYIIKTALYIALHENVLDEDTLNILKDSFDNVKTKVGMPTNIEAKKLQKYHSPTLVIASEKDCLFPAKKVLHRVKQIISDCQTVELKGSGHMHILPKKEKDRIIKFLKQD
ncbi:MAG: alpha/beta hydrolase [Clostridium sp.]|nr:alpha/beta hydrolase [Clostridium sp.]